MKKTCLVLLAIALLSAANAFAAGKTEDSGEGVNVDDRGRAAFGRDVVAYYALEPDQPSIEGDPELSFVWKGAEWLFSTRENRDAFAAGPEKYAPRYGGYCSYAMSQNKLIYSDPDAWALNEGQLYLFYQESGRSKWRNDSDGFIALADKHWPGHLKTLLEKGMKQVP